MPRWSQFYIELYKENFKRLFLLNLFVQISPNLTGMISGWSPTKIVQIVLIGCVSRSRGQKLVFYCNFQKTYLVYNIIKRSSTKDVQIMPLGFSINGSTVTFSSGERPSCLMYAIFKIIKNVVDYNQGFLT